MSRKKLLGNLPLIEKGLNKGRLDRKKTAVMFGFTDKQIYKAYNNWIQIFRKFGSNLTLEQYLVKMVTQSLTPNHLGNGVNDYHLCRDNDEGGYTNDNCSFKLKSENLDEQVQNGKNWILSSVGRAAVF